MPMGLWMSALGTEFCPRLLPLPLGREEYFVWVSWIWAMIYSLKNRLSDRWTVVSISASGEQWGRVF